MIKGISTVFFCLSFFFCSAQNQLLTYQDLQYILQNQPKLLDNFLQQKNFQPRPTGNNDSRYFALYADVDYTDVLVTSKGRHVIVVLSTTHQQQFEVIQKALNFYTPKNSKNGKIYRVKDGTISTILLKEDEAQNTPNKLYTIELEN